LKRFLLSERNIERRSRFAVSRLRHRLHGLDETWRRQRGRDGLWRFGRFLGGTRLLALDDRHVGENVAGRQRDVSLSREAIDELPRHNLFDRAGGASHLDAVIALEQRRDFLAGGAQELSDLVNPNCGQYSTLSLIVRRFCDWLRRILSAGLIARRGENLLGGFASDAWNLGQDVGCGGGDSLRRLEARVHQFSDRLFTDALERVRERRGLFAARLACRALRW
jgi:hypothetical protein